MMKKNEFEILTTIEKNPNANREELELSLNWPASQFISIYRCLENAGLIQGGVVTAKGMLELEPFRVNNAIILAAGKSSRFAPLSDKKPKGLFRVRGEVLIERQIRQLLAAKVNDIEIVVGYKKELFYYLEKKYGVGIIVNPDFSIRNNHSSLMHARESLGSTYVCSSDNYFTQNPFGKYEWKAYYAAQYSEKPTKEWCLDVDENDRIRGVTIGGDNSWYMCGHVYFDKRFSESFKRILIAEYNTPEIKDKLWETLYVEHIDELDMNVKRYQPGVIYEFDSEDELKSFDPFFRL